MKVEVAAELWADEEAFGPLQRLMQRASQGQHTVIALVENPESILDGPFFKNAVSPTDIYSWSELLRRTLGAARNAPPSRTLARVVVGGSSARRIEGGFTLSIADLGDWAERPLVVLLENQTDWILVSLAAQTIPSEDDRRRLSDAVQCGWIVPDGRGGTGELLKSISEVNLARRVAVIDSDRDEWSDRPAKENQISKAQSAGQVTTHVLSGREAENYLPKRFLERSSMKKKDKKNHRVARENHLWSHIHGSMRRDQARLERLHGKDAFDEVERIIEKKMSRQTTVSSQSRLAEEHFAMNEEERAVDDLKARLGASLCSSWMEKTRDRMSEVSSADINSCLVSDLVSVSRMILEWL